MADVLGQGPDDRPPPRRWLLPVGVVVAVAAVAFAVTRPEGATRSAGSAPASTLPASSSAAREDPQPWPSAPGACGSEAPIPLRTTAALDEHTGLTVLLGGAGLRLVDVDTGAERPLVLDGGGGGGSQYDRDGQVSALASSPAGVHAVRERCGSTVPPVGTVLALRLERGTATTALAGDVDTLLSGPDAVWALTYAEDPHADPMVLRPLDGGAPVRLPVGFEPSAATATDFVGTVLTSAEPPGDGFPVAAVARAAPTTVRQLGLGGGWVVAATDDLVVVYPGCEPPAACAFLVARPRSGAAVRRIPVPAGRTLASGVVLSADGRYAAFQLSRRDPQPRYSTGHPWASSTVAVLDLPAGRLSLVPGVELAPKSAAGLAFSRDGRWLLLALNEGRRTRLLVWRPGLAQPRESPARLVGSVAYQVPVLDVTGRAVAAEP